MNFKRIICALSFIIALQTLRAADSDVLPIARIKEPIEFSGFTKTNVWELATPIELYMHAPSFGQSPKERTEVRIGYDDQYLWVFARMHYTDPSKIVSTSKKRDEESRNSDSFGIVLDTYDDNQSGLAFFTTPSGQRIDYAISNDAVFQPGPPGAGGGGNQNYSWNTFWDVKTSKTSDGWSSEMRIPFSSLRFQDINGKVKMGLILNRTTSYCNEIDTYPEIDPKYGVTAYIKPSLAKTIELDGLKPLNPIYIAPYVLTGLEQNQVLNEAGTQYNKDNNPRLTGGVDIKYSVTSNLTLDLTANTDFAQVEADDEYVNLTRYNMYLPEKRMFFQERSSIFGFNLGRQQELFYSRRIGLNDGLPVRIYGGARLTGRVGKWDIGALDMQTEKFNTSPSENFGVFRVRRQVINANSYVGAMTTSRIGMNGENSMAYGIDGVFRLFGDDYLQARFAQTSNTQAQSNSFKSNSFAYLRWERRNDKGFGYDVNYAYSGLEFNPSAGFMEKLGTAGVDVMTQYGWLPGEKSKLRTIKLLGGYSYSKWIVNNKLESSEQRGGVDMSFKSGWMLMGMLTNMKEGVLNEFFLAKNASIPVGEYSQFRFNSQISTPYSKKVVLDLNSSIGEFFDGNLISLGAKPTLNLSSSLQLSCSYSYNRINLDKRDQRFVSHIAQLKALFMYNTKLSLSSFVQYNSLNSVFVGNFRLRYNPSEGNDFFLVYNETRPGSGYSFGEASHVSFLSRMILLKYVYTFKI